MTIVGSKYCPGAHDFIIKTSRKPLDQRTKQFLFLVNDPKTDEVMLHNGKNRLGSVADTEKKAIRALITKLSDELGQDQVLVCHVKHIEPSHEWTIKTGSSLRVIPTHHVYERLARKFSDKYRKD